MIAIKDILVPTDFGEASDAALAYGRELARSFGATMHVLSVAENMLLRYPSDMYAAMNADIQSDYEESVRQQVEALLTKDDRQRARARSVLRVSNAPASAIVDYAKEAQIDLIVMGTHGRGGVPRLFLGSVAERVVRTAPCPVLTVRHPKREFLTPDSLAAVAKA